jgi:hypothetical protein
MAIFSTLMRNIQLQLLPSIAQDPNDLDKTRPRDGLSAPSDHGSSRHNSSSNDAAEHLLPQGQFGVGMPSGLDFIIHSAMADRATLERSHPTRALVLLDINMFNAVSREACRSALEEHDEFRALLPSSIYSIHPTISAGTVNQTERSQLLNKLKDLRKDALSDLSLPALYYTSYSLTSTPSFAVEL